MIDSYTVKEAATILGIPKGRVWELIARGVLSGTPQGGGGMRVYLRGGPEEASEPAAKPAVQERTTVNGNAGNGGGSHEASPFREVLTEFRNLTERYGQALLALGEARGEVAALRSRVELLEARIELRLPAPPAPYEPPMESWSPAPVTQPSEQGGEVVAPTAEPAAATAAPAAPTEQPAAAGADLASEPPPDTDESARTSGLTAPAESFVEPELAEVPGAHVDSIVAPEAGPPTEAGSSWPEPSFDPGSPAVEPARRHRRRRSGSRSAVEGFAEALARADDPSSARLPGGEEAAEAFAALRAEMAPVPSRFTSPFLPEEEEISQPPAAPSVDIDELMADDLIGHEPPEAELADRPVPSAETTYDVGADAPLPGAEATDVAAALEAAATESESELETFAGTGDEQETDVGAETPMTDDQPVTAWTVTPLDTPMDEAELPAVLDASAETAEPGSAQAEPVEAPSAEASAAEQATDEVASSLPPGYTASWEEPDWIAEEDLLIQEPSVPQPSVPQPSVPQLPTQEMVFSEPASEEVPAELAQAELAPAEPEPVEQAPTAELTVEAPIDEAQAVELPDGSLISEPRVDVPEPATEAIADASGPMVEPIPAPVAEGAWEESESEPAARFERVSLDAEPEPPQPDSAVPMEPMEPMELPAELEVEYAEPLAENEAQAVESDAEALVFGAPPAEPSAEPSADRNLDLEELDAAVDLAVEPPARGEVPAEAKPSPPARDAPASAMRDAPVEEELMWLGDEFQTSRPTAPTAQPTAATLRPSAAALPGFDDTLARMARERGWDTSEIAAIRGLLAEPGNAPIGIQPLEEDPGMPVPDAQEDALQRMETATRAGEWVAGADEMEVAIGSADVPERDVVAPAQEVDALPEMASLDQPEGALSASAPLPEGDELLSLERSGPSELPPASEEARPDTTELEQALASLRALAEQAEQAERAEEAEEAEQADEPGGTLDVIGSEAAEDTEDTDDTADTADTADPSATDAAASAEPDVPPATVTAEPVDASEAPQRIQSGFPRLQITRAAPDDWLHGRRGPAADAYRRLRRLFPR